MLEAQRNPVKRPVDEAKLRRRPRILEASKLGPVTVPENEDRVEDAPDTQQPRQ